MRRLLTCILFIATGAAAPSVATTAAPYEYVFNGSFAAGTDGWLAAPGTPLTALTANGPHARIVLDGDAFSIRQRLDGAMAAGPYTLAFDVRADTTVRVSATVELTEGGTLRTVQAETSPSWRTISAIQQLAAAGAAVLTISGTGPPGAVVDIGAVSLQGPPPVTITPTPSATLSPTPEPAPEATPPVATPTATATIGAAIASELRNGGFEQVTETGTIADWDAYGGEATRVDAPVRTGDRAARFESLTASTKWLFQRVLIDGGSGYAFDAWVWHDDPAVSAAYLRISWYASDDGSGEAVATSDSLARLDVPVASWRHLTTGGVAAPPDARSASLRMMLDPASAAPAAIYVDDASFAPAAVDAAAQPVLAAAPEQRSAPTTGTTTRSREVRPSARATTGGDAVASGDAAADGARVIINEVLYDPLEDETAGEWVELYNAGTEPASLAGWTLRDGAAGDVLPALTLEPGAFAVVGPAGGEAAALGVPFIAVSGRIGNGLGNDGDALVLLDGAGEVMDAISWGDNAYFTSPPMDDVPEGYSIERMPAGAFSFDENPAPSPGRGVDAAPLPSRANSIDVLRSPPGARYAWALWAVAATAVAALGCAVAWRVVEAWRARTPAA